MKFWDSSALFPAFVEESRSGEIRSLLGEDPEVTVWALTPVELWSAVARRRREGQLGSPEIRRLRTELADHAGNWAQVQDIAAVRSRAVRVLDTHPLRAADALQLAAALVLTGDRPSLLPFVTLDEDLAEAAEREGFRVLPGPAA